MSDHNRKILVAGGTGYLGGHVLKELKDRDISCVSLVRSASQAKKIQSLGFETAIGQLTQAETLEGIFEGVDTVFSSVGITRQKDGLAYQDVDYRGNLNLLQAALEAGVKRFVYVSVFRGKEFRHVELINAKEQFVEELQAENIESCIVRPTGFFSDMGDFFKMAQRGQVFLFGSGESVLNPISGDDLAKVCVDAVLTKAKEVNVGGPDVFTQNDIARLAFKVIGKKPQIFRLPLSIAKFGMWIAKRLAKQSDYGAMEMYLEVSNHRMVAPQFGTRTLEAYFREIA